MRARYAQRRRESTVSEKVARPWGTYEVTDRGDGFLVKRVSVAPGGQLSLQYHRHRSEHWVVVRGTAWVTQGKEQFSLRANESTYISAGTVHRLENRGAEMLEIIEVQCGDPLIEDDIVRLEDRYGRETPSSGTLTRDAYAREIAASYAADNPAVQQVYRCDGQNEGHGPILLLVSDEDTLPAGIVPVWFGVERELRGAPVCVVLVTPRELDQINEGVLLLEEGWVARDLIYEKTA